MLISPPSTSPRRKPLASINVTPLIDVLLILLVVLMMCIPMFVKRLPVELPRTDLNGSPVIVKSLPVAITEDGRLLVKEAPVELKVLQQQITPSTSVELSVDKVVPYEKLAVVVAAIQDRGPKEIVLLTR